MGDDPPADNAYAADVSAIGHLDVVPTLLDTVCRITGMGFAAIARVTDDKWVACSVRDNIDFGLLPGGELKLETTICHEIRQHRQAVVISDVDADPAYAAHHTPALYGLKSYISVPIVLPEGRFFGTLCAIDPRPHDLGRRDILPTFEMFARLIALQLDQVEKASVMHDAGEAMRNSEALHRQILDSATDFAIIATDLDGRVTRWNAGAENILGWTERDMMGEPVDRFFTPEDRAAGRPLAEMRLALERGHGNDERWHLRADGTRFWAQGEMTPLRRFDDEVVGFVKVLRDRTAERLREQRLDLLARASAGLLSSDDPDRVLQDILSSGADTLGYDQSYSYLLNNDCTRMRLLQSTGVEEEVREWLADACPADVPLCGLVAESRTPLILDHVQQSTDPRTQISRRHGTRAYAGFPVQSEDKLYGVISFVSTVHDRFESEALSFFESFARFLSIGRERLDREAALSDLAMTLERRVEERTRDLVASEEALRHSQRMDAIGQLTGGVAHDFNNLLTVIRGSVDLLRRSDLPEERRARYIAAIGDTADRATRLTSQLLAFSRRQTLHPTTFDVAERLRGVADMLNSVTGARVTVTLEIPDEVCIVRADVSQFETAFVNMAVNARDAMAGEGALRIGLACAVDKPHIRGHAAVDGPFVAISLADTGTGIASGNIARIFEPFFTTKEVGKGTGLGLSQVFGFAKQSGGDVDVESTPGVGTRFVLYLPEADGDTRVEAVVPIAERVHPTRGLSILVVEDNEEVGRFASEALDDMGYRTTLVPSAEDALDALGAAIGSFDAVFSDVVMPGMGGLELAKRLRQTWPHMPVVLASGYSHVLAQEGAHGFLLLQKPYSADQLAQAIDKLVIPDRSPPSAPAE
ncbi:GAF domain-containing protein [Sphingomonas sp. RP10(2022)]|uniref:histidine kinase n=1 Tax=Sphingomonas liriopis TaxID=2949094 RepID=A0A9X2KT83_9SPHN|nr:GAF domain-containing protein [Sphingomonas liriopis]MCP3734623.1 GAF domain-containing protein [Sphingomonas liriopis]